MCTIERQLFVELTCYHIAENTDRAKVPSGETPGPAAPNSRRLHYGLCDLAIPRHQD